MKLVNTVEFEWERLEDGSGIESNNKSKATTNIRNGSLEDELSTISKLKDAKSAEAIKQFFLEQRKTQTDINKEVINTIQTSNRSLLVHQGLLQTIGSTIQQNQSYFNRFKKTYPNSSTFSFPRALVDSKLYDSANNKVEQGIYQASPYIQIWQSGLILLGCCPDSTRQRANDGLFGRETLAQSIFFQRVCRDNGANDIKVNGVPGFKELNLMQLFFQKGIRIQGNKLIDTNGKQVWLSKNYVKKDQPYEVSYIAPTNNRNLKPKKSNVNGLPAPSKQKEEEEVTEKIETVSNSAINDIITYILGASQTAGVNAIAKTIGDFTMLKGDKSSLQVIKDGQTYNISIISNNKGELTYKVIDGSNKEVYNSSTNKTAGAELAKTLEEIKSVLVGYKTNADKANADKANADKANADKANADKANADKANADKANADKANADKANADKANADKANADKANADKAKETDPSKSRTKDKYENAMEKLYGDENKPGVLFETKYSDERIDKNSKLQIGEQLIQLGNTLSKDPNKKVAQQGKELIAAGEQLKQTAKGIKTITFDEQTKKIDQLTNGTDGRYGLFKKKGIGERIQKYMKSTSKEVGESVDKTAESGFVALEKIQKVYGEYDTQIKDQEKVVTDSSSEFDTIFSGKKFEDLTPNQLSKAKDLLVEKLLAQDEIATLKNKKINDINEVGPKTKKYYEDHAQFIDLVAAPFQTQLAKLTEGQKKITDKITKLKGDYEKHQNIINAINTGSYTGNLDSDLQTYSKTNVSKDLSDENKKSLLVSSLQATNKIIADELSFYVSHLTGEKPDYSQSIINLSKDQAKQDGGINKQIQELTAKLNIIKEQKLILDNAIKYIALNASTEVATILYDQAVEGIKSDIKSYTTMAQSYLDADSQAKGQTGDALNDTRSKQRAIQRETYQKTLAKSINAHKVIIETRGDKPSVASIKLQETSSDKLVIDSQKNMDELNKVDLTKIVTSNNLTIGKLVDQKKDLSTLKALLKKSDGSNKELPFDLINPATGEKTVDFSKKMIPTKESKYILASERIMSMYSKLNGENTATKIPPTPPKPSQ